MENRFIRASPERVDLDLALEVAGTLLGTPDNPHDATVRAAYRELERQTDAIFQEMTRDVGRRGLKVRFTCCGRPYDSDEELVGAVRGLGVLEITTSAKARDRRHPLLDCEFGGSNDRFRAVHDMIGHVYPRLGFDRDGEFGAWLIQERFYYGLARWALATELHAQHSVWWSTGDPADYKAILIDLEILDRVRNRRGRQTRDLMELERKECSGEDKNA